MNVHLSDHVALCLFVRIALTKHTERFKVRTGDIPGGPMAKNLPANARDMGLIPGPEDPTCRGSN